MTFGTSSSFTSSSSSSFAVVLLLCVCAFLADASEKREARRRWWTGGKKRIFGAGVVGFFYVFLDPKKSLSFFLSFFLLCVDLGFGVCTQFFFTKVGCLFRYLRQIGEVIRSSSSSSPLSSCCAATPPATRRYRRRRGGGGGDIDGIVVALPPLPAETPSSEEKDECFLML